MKKFTLFFLCLFLLTGCSSKSETEDTAASITMMSADQMEETLKNAGWNVQDTTAASFHLWENLNPSFLILGENKNDEVLLVGCFDTDTNAKAAYFTLVPASDDHSASMDREPYEQSLVTLDDNQGYWFIRHINNYVMAAWMSGESQTSEFESLFSSLETSSTTRPASESADNGS